MDIIMNGTTNNSTPTFDQLEPNQKTSIFTRFSKIAFKLPATIILASTIAALSAGLFGYYQINQNLTVALDERVDIILNNQKNRLSTYLTEIENDLHQKAINIEVANALVEFDQAWQGMSGSPEKQLQKAYITDNKNALGEKEKLNFAPQKNAYNSAHKTYHPPMRDFLYARGYYDIFLFNLNGDLIYSVFKELDYATNLSSGKYADTGLGTVFRAGLKLSAGQQVFDDFKPYSPSHGAAAAFIAEPIFGKSGKRLGVIAYQMPIDNMNNIMKSNGQLGATGETFIIGDDGLMRSDSELHEEFKILQTKVSAPILSRSTADNVVISHGEIYNQKNSIMAATNLKFHNSIWTLVAVQELDEAFAPLINARNLIAIVVAIVLALIGFLGYLISRSITKPISGLTNVMSLIANGKLETQVEGADGVDEIAYMAKAVLVFKDNAKANIALEKQQIIDRETMQQQSKQEQQNFATSFQENIVGLIENVGNSCHDMGQNAQDLIADSMQSIEQSNTAKTASERASMNVQNVAAASEQLSSSIEEISRQVNQSRGIVSEAMIGAETTNKKVEDLSEAANGIGEVISLIQSIAEQTNLLALNATIEAARAGDAGKGFAVVATEVKALANQTARATEDISSHISSIQTSTGETVAAIGEITQTMDKVNEITAVIAAAVEQQGSATSLISENIQEASNETALVSENMVVVTTGADKANQSANQMNSATEMMNVQTKELQSQVDDFIKEIMVG